MAFAPEIVSRARAQLRAKKEEKQGRYERDLAIAYERFPRLAEIDRALRATMAKTVAVSLRAGEDPAAAIAEIKKENLALQREREWILDAADLGEDFLDETPVCDRCGGEGYIGEAMCDCLFELCRAEQRKALSSMLALGDERFDTFRLDLYSPETGSTYGVSPRENMKNVYRTVRAWALNFIPGAKSLLFTGGTGLGKTFLSACAARAVAEEGHSVVYESAVKLLSDFEAEKFGHEAEGTRTAKYFGCDLLVLDDLGTEMTTQFTVSALYQLLNTRLMEKKSVILSTNLSLNAIRERYGVALYSRLAGEYEGLLFFGQDIRLMEK